jgi:hypothetical protein
MEIVEEYGLVRATNDNRSAQVIQIESSKLLPSIILLAILAVGGLLFAAFAWSLASYAEREARLTDYYVNILNQTLVEQGLRKPEDNLLEFKRTHKE